MNITCETGRIEAGVNDVVYFPAHRVNRNPVIYCHGGNGTALQAIGVLLPGIPNILKALCKRAFLITALTTPANPWGNDSAVSDVAQALAWARNHGATGKAVLIGTSMGAAAMFNYAADNPTEVACIVGFIPAIDLQAIRVADVGPGARAGIDAAYGVTYPAALPSGVNPATRTSELTGIPIQIWTASDDLISINSSDFTTATDADHYNVGPVGHDDDAIQAVNISIVERFIESALY